VLIGLICVPIIIVAFIITLWILYCRRKKQGVYRQIAIPDGNIFVIDEEEGGGGREGPYLQTTVIDAHLSPSTSPNRGGGDRRRRGSGTRRGSKSFTNWFGFFSSAAAGGGGGGENDDDDSWHNQRQNISSNEEDSLPVKTIHSSSTLATRLQHLDDDRTAAISIIPKSIPGGSPQQTPRRGGGNDYDDDEEEEENRKLSQINRNMLMRSNSKTKITTPSPGGGGGGGGRQLEGIHLEEKKLSPSSPVKKTNSLQGARGDTTSAAVAAPGPMNSQQQSQSQSQPGLLSSLWSIFQGKRGASVALQEMSSRTKSNSPPDPHVQNHHHHLGVNLDDDDNDDVFTDQFISPSMNQSPVKQPAVASPPPPPTVPPNQSPRVLEEELTLSPVTRYPPVTVAAATALRTPSPSLSFSSPRHSPQHMTGTVLSSPDSFTDEVFTTGSGVQRNSSPSPRRLSSGSPGSGDGSGVGVWATVNEKMKAEKRVKGLTTPKTSPAGVGGRAWEGGDEDHEQVPSPSDWFDQDLGSGTEPSAEIMQTLEEATEEEREEEGK
jgi:hypothetical protein